jgi:hypothetical protein
LTLAEKQIVFHSIAELLRSHNEQWQNLAVGICCIVKDGNKRSSFVVFMDAGRRRVVLDEQLYQGAEFLTHTRFICFAGKVSYNIIPLILPAGCLGVQFRLPAGCSRIREHCSTPRRRGEGNHRCRPCIGSTSGQ